MVMMDHSGGGDDIDDDTPVCSGSDAQPLPVKKWVLSEDR